MLHNKMTEIGTVKTHGKIHFTQSKKLIMAMMPSPPFAMMS